MSNSLIFREGLQDRTMVSMIASILGLFPFVILAVIMDSVTAGCRPDPVLYAAFITGLTMTLLGGIPAAILFIKAKGLTSQVNFGLGVMQAGLVMLLLSTLFIIGVEGRLYLLPLC